MKAIERFKFCESSADRKALVAEFDIIARAHLRLLPGKTWKGSGDALNDRCYLFAFDARIKDGESGSFLLGETDAQDFLDLTGQPQLPCFDPLISAVSSPPRGPARESLNSELYSVLNLLIILVDEKPEPLFLKHFEFFNLYPEKRPFDERVRKVNHLVGHLADGASLRELIGIEPGLRPFEFPEINEILLQHNLPNHIDP